MNRKRAKLLTKLENLRKRRQRTRVAYDKARIIFGKASVRIDKLINQEMLITEEILATNRLLQENPES